MYLQYITKFISKISNLLKQLLSSALDIFSQIFKSIEFLNVKLLAKWIGFTCFFAALLSNSPDNLVDPTLKHACSEYLQTYKSVYILTTDSILELFTDTKKLELQLQMIEQQHIKNLTELHSFTNTLLDSINKEHSDNVKNIIKLTENTIQSLQTINDTKISFLEQEIKRLNENQDDSTKELYKLILSNQQMISTLANTKQASTLSYLSATLGIIHGFVGGLLSVHRLFNIWNSSSSKFESQTTESLKYLEQAVDILCSTKPDPENPIFPEGVSISRRANISSTPVD
jgi:hypothetical protein